MISKRIKDNKQLFTSLFNNSSDFVAYEFESLSKIRMMVCYIEGLVDRDILDRDIIESLILNVKKNKGY